MSPERWKQIEEIFNSAIELSPDERPAFLAQACGDDAELRREVERLIGNDAAAGDFIASPVHVSHLTKLLDQTVTDHSLLLNATPTDQMIGRQVGAYRLEREIGRGGMGAVYLAVRADNEFYRRVAIKLVKGGMDSDFIIRRFRHERQILASFDHPNIARLLDGGTTEDGRPWFAMEYIEGLPVTRWCDERRLSIHERLRLFLQICAAVQYAHQRQVIHRDIKPGNILVTEDGQPKLLDFGIARILDPELLLDSGELTVAGIHPMTPEYASPEQVQGQPVTPASDQYALGVLLYELLTGRRPYRLRNRLLPEIARIICDEVPELPSAAIHRAEEIISTTDRHPTPELVSRQRSTTPEELSLVLSGGPDNIVMQALQKDPQRRYGSVAELAEDISRCLHGLPVAAPACNIRPADPYETGLISALPAQNSIAILPLKPLLAEAGTGATHNFLSVGLADALITRLSNIHSLTVRPTASVIRYAKADSDALTAGRELGVSHVLDGRFLQSGDRIRVTVQLINVHTAAPQWAAQFDKSGADLLELQDSLSEQLVQEIARNLTGEERIRVARRGTENPEAYEAYLRGRYHWHTYTDEGLARAITCFYEAIALDPNFAAAYTGVADYFNWMGITSVLPPDECFLAAKEAATKAVQLDDKLAEAYTSLAIATWAYDWDSVMSSQLLRRAIELNPNYAQAHQWLAQFRSVQGRHPEAITTMNRALELDPQSPARHAMMAFVLHNARQHAEAWQHAQRGLEIEPHHPLALQAKAWIGPHLGRFDEALSACRRVVEVTERAPIALWALGYTLAVTGKRREARTVLNEMLSLARSRYIPNYFFARLHTALGDTDQAFEQLNRSFDHYESWAQEITVDPQLDPLRSDPRFARLIARIRPRHSSDSEETVADQRPETVRLDKPTTGEPVSPSGRLKSLPAAIGRQRRRYSLIIATAFCALALIVTTILYFRPRPTAVVMKDGIPVNLTRHIAVDRFPRVSPDGKQIVFISNRDGLPEVYVMKAGGSDVRRLTYNSAEELAPSWSPDGTRIVYDVLTASGAGSDIWMMNSDGSNQTNLTRGSGFNSRAVFSPDGKLLAFASRRDTNEENNFDIYVMNADGTAQRRVTSDPAFETESAWSPDGKRLAFTRETGRGASDIFVISVDGAGLFNLTRTPNTRNGQPAWSPDGKLIAFVSDRHSPKNSSDIWVMNADGSNPHPVTRSQSLNIEPSWMPDNRHLVFQTHRDGNSEIYLTDSAENSEIRHGSASSLARSVAVLPFRTASAGETDESLGLGLADVLTTRLGQLRQLSVSPFSAVRRYAGNQNDPVRIGRELNVEHVVSGTLQHNGDRVRVSAQMQQISDGRILWAETFDEKFTDLGSLQHAIASRVLRALTLELTGSELAQLNKTWTENSEAYQLYLVGRYHFNKRSVAELSEAIRYFNQALQLDNRFALAYVGLADSYALLQLYQGPPVNLYPRAKENALKALALDESLAEAHSSLAYVSFYYDRDRIGAEREFRRAIELNPSYVTAHHWFAHVLAAEGRESEALAEIRLAEQLDPRSPIVKTAVALVWFYAREYEQALEACRRALELDPGLVPAHRVMRWIHQAQGRYDEALAAYQQEKSFSGFSGHEWPAILAQIQAIGGRRDEALTTLTRGLATPEGRREADNLPFEVALAYALIGNHDQALRWMERAEATKAYVFNFAQADPRLDKLRTDPRFTDLLRKAGL
ncbi:MAG TPA: protein kinase [Blastocatellia bacterium]|nr:protein kinase [Blastocatellia bacterium]